MEYVEERRIVEEIEKECTEELRIYQGEDIEKEKKRIYQGIYESVIESYANYLYFDSICFWDEDNNRISKVAFYYHDVDEVYKHDKEDTLLAIGTKVYLAKLKYKMKLDTENKYKYECEFNITTSDIKLDREISEFNTKGIYKYVGAAQTYYGLEYIYSTVYEKENS